MALNGLPIGLPPEGVTDFEYNESGRFEVHLDQACNAKFEDELHYDQNVSGNMSYGQIGGLSGISGQDLFLWFPVKEIRVDFSLSSFEIPRECLASEDQIVVEIDFSCGTKLPVNSQSTKVNGQTAGLLIIVIGLLLYFKKINRHLVIGIVQKQRKLCPIFEKSVIRNIYTSNNGFGGGPTVFAVVVLEVVAV
ncbi:uncharacterized protein LOC110942896 [Helianthus annuus]|uniref:uncharacterized protein LOC110942896 n=1 Tax=Helianthus annuus TaxID=4232 RepID=UPI000B8F3546|nr:uncharacterized protein LOC110942896 [Helianthus annuus]